MPVINSKWREIISQLILWLLIVAGVSGMFYSVEYIRHGSTIARWYREAVPLLLIMAIPAPFIAILHYYWLFKGYLSKKKYATYLLMLIPFAVIMVLANFLCDLPGFLAHLRNIWVYRRVWSIIFMSIGPIDIPFILFYTTMRGAIEMKNRRRTLEKERERTAIQLLKNQLEPHFLFNTLNAIYATAQKEKADKTILGIEELSGFVRYATETANKDSVPIEDELKFIKQYQYLQHMDSINATNIPQTINWDRKPINITPLLLLPFAEYAFERVGSVDINIENGILHLSIKYPGSDETDRKGGSLSDARKRLEIEYKNNYQFEERNEAGNNMLHLTINLLNSSSVTA